MSYTVWSRGRLLGSTELGYRYQTSQIPDGRLRPDGAWRKADAHSHRAQPRRDRAGAGLRDTQLPLSLDGDPFRDDWSSEDFGAFDSEREAALEKAIGADRALLDEMHKDFDDLHDWDESSDSDLPRYQTHVRLIDTKSVP